MCGHVDDVKREPKYKVGDKITIKPDLNTEMQSDNLFVVDEMLEYAGKETTIAKVDEYGDYFLDIDDKVWYWAEEFFAEIEA